MEIINEDEKINKYIAELELYNFISPNCNTCKSTFYPALKKGTLFSNIFAPSHTASRMCESGKHDHCTCDSCF